GGTMQLSIVSLDEGLFRVRSEGDISLIDQIRSNNPLEKLLGQGCFSRKILLNMEKSAYIDSSGVSWLIKCHKLCQAEGGKLVRHLGLVRLLTILPSEMGKRCMSHIKVMAGMDLAEQRRPLDGRWVRGGEANGNDGLAVDLRISTIPTLYGEDFSIRLLSRTS